MVNVNEVRAIASATIRCTERVLDIGSRGSSSRRTLRTGAVSDVGVRSARNTISINAADSCSVGLPESVGK